SLSPIYSQFVSLSFILLSIPHPPRSSLFPYTTLFRSGVLAGFFIVWAMIGVGWVVGRSGVLGPHGRYVLNRSTFFVASPALVLVGLLESDVRAVLSLPMLVASIAGLST